MTVSATAHARQHPVRLQERLPFAARELAALIGMNQHPGPRLSSPYRPYQRLQNEIGGHGRARRPADDLPRVQVHHGRQKQPAFVGADVGDVRDPDAVRCLGPEFPVEDVAHHTDRAAPVAGLAAVADLCTEALRIHQASHPMPAASFAGFAQVERDLAVAVYAAAGRSTVVLGQAQHALVFTIALARRLLLPTES